MGRDIYVYNELRGRLGTDEVVRVHCGAVALRAWGLFVDAATTIESFISSCIKVAFTSLGLRVSGRRTHPLLPVEDISGSIGISCGLTDAPTTAKRPATS